MPEVMFWAISIFFVLWEQGCSYGFEIGGGKTYWAKVLRGQAILSQIIEGSKYTFVTLFCPFSPWFSQLLEGRSGGGQLAPLLSLSISVTVNLSKKVKKYGATEKLGSHCSVSGRIFRKVAGNKGNGMVTVKFFSKKVP